MLRDRLVSGRTIISAVRCHLANRIVNLIEQRADLGRIVGVVQRRVTRGGELTLPERMMAP